MTKPPTSPNSRNVKAARYFEQGAKVHADGQVTEAVALYRRGLALAPHFAPGYLCLGLGLAMLDQHAEAEEVLKRAISLDGAMGGAYLAIGKLRAIQGDLEAAVGYFRTAAHYNPESAATYAEIWKAANDLLMLDDRVWAGRHYVALRPDDIEARWDLGLHELTIGELETGWKGYDFRWQHPKYQRWHYPLPQAEWTGQDLSDERILVWREQGVGDEIMFASCLPDLIAAAGHVTVACTDRLMPLFTRSFPGAEIIDADRLIPSRNETFEADYQVAIGGIPRWLRPTVSHFPDHHGYLKPDPIKSAQWRARLAALGPGLKVGISWRSSLMTTDRAKEYSTLDQWGPVLQTPGVTFVNLQYDDCTLALANAEDAFGVHVHRWPDLDLKNDFDGSAALIENLDLVITIGNAVGELAGAVGTPVWRLLSAELGDWTMLGTGRRPWFPSMRVFGASPRNDWTALLHRVGGELAEFAPRIAHAEVAA